MGYSIWINEEELDDNLNSNCYSPQYLDTIEKLENSSHTIERLNKISKKITDGPFGSSLKTTDYRTSGFPVFRVKNVINCQLDLTDIVYIDDIKQTELKRSQVYVGDILITKAGRIGSAAVAENFPNRTGNITSHLILARLKDNYDSRYVTAFLESKYGKIISIRESYKTTRPELTKTEAERIPVLIPSPEIQKYIGDKVKKAEKTREEAKECLKEARNLFDAQITFPVKPTTKFDWISDFLVSDNISPKFYRQFDLLKENKKGFNYFDFFIKSIKCGDPIEKDARHGTDFKYYGASGPIDTIGKFNFSGDYLIVSQDGSIGIANVAREKFWANNHVWVIKLKKGDYEFFELYLNEYPYWNSLVTGSVVPKVTAENLRKVIILDVEESIQNQIGNLIRNAKQKENYTNNLIGSAIKDVESLIEGNFEMTEEFINLIE